MILAVVDAHRTFYERKLKRMGFTCMTFNGAGALWYRWTDGTLASLRLGTNCVPAYSRGGRTLTTDEVIEMYLQLRAEDEYEIDARTVRTCRMGRS
jgi:hypothetical protein